MEYGFETNGTFVVVCARLKRVESGDEIIARNKDPEKKLKFTGIINKSYSRSEMKN
jgi:hypothetical protein